jgi:hypothetical protein
MGEDYITISKRRKGESFADNQNRLLSDVIISVGSVVFENFKTNKEREAFVKKMHTGDRTQILAVARQFSFGFPKEFPLKWIGENSKGEKIEVKKIYTFEKPKVEVKPNEDGEEIEDKIESDNEDFVPLFPTHLAKYQAQEYANLPDMIDTVLPKSKAEVKLLIGTGEVEATMSGKESPSLLDILSSRKPTYKEDGVWLPLPLKKLSAIDITHLFNIIKETEGRIDSEIRFDHPDAENMPENKKKVIVNLLSISDFFLPSEGKI